MLKQFDSQTVTEIKNFKLPSFNEIPNVGLFLEQTTKYIGEYLNPLGESISLTGSMISNYVKKDIIKNPVKKQYAREEIAYLIFIAIAKSVLSLDDIQVLLNLQRESVSCEKSYEFFRNEFQKTLCKVFNIAYSADKTCKEPDIKEAALLESTIITVCHKIYLDKYFIEIKKTVTPGLN